MLNFISYFHILQLEEYNIGRFLKWCQKNPLGKKLENKKPLVWTEKLRFIAVFSFFCGIAFIFILYKFVGLAFIFFTPLLFFLKFIFIILAVITRFPYEIINKKIVIAKTRNKIIKYKKEGLVVIGITGSFGKTTCKEFLYRILNSYKPTLKTPESYNTLFGIAKVVNLELDLRHKFFVCEMGAYKRGEIKEICKMVIPDYAILTGINEQHLERFKNIENTIKAKFELVEAVGNEENIVLNGDCENVFQNYKTFVKNPHLLFSKNKTINNPNLIGKANKTNALLASEMAKVLKIPESIISTSLSNLKPFSHRLEVRKLESGVTILDDSYNSNIDGFNQALNALSNFKGTKIIATPGIVELGNKTDEVHKNLGEMCDKVCDYIFLVGKSDRVEGLALGIKSKNKIVHLKSIKDLNLEIANLKINPPITVLIENDLPDNYN